MKPLYIIAALLLLALAAWYFFMRKPTATTPQTIQNLTPKQQAIIDTVSTQTNLVSIAPTDYTGGAMSSTFNSPSLKKTVSIP